jgi:hypothetical protein
MALAVLTDVLSVDVNGVVSAVKFNLGRTWQNVTAQRVSGTPYVNNTGLPIQVNTWITNDDSAVLNIVVDGVTVAQYVTNSTTSGATGTLSAEVPAGSTYTITVSSGTIAAVVELRKN